MIELIVRHLVVLGLAGICSVILRRRSAALRHALWTVALVLCLLLPVLPRVPIEIPAPSAPTAIVEPETSRAGIQGYAVALDAPTAPASVAPAPTFPWATLAWGVYLAVALALVLRWTIGWGLAARLARRGKRLGAARGVPVVAVEGVGPLTFGWPRGVIVVPNSEFALDKLVLRHEVAHVQRGDFVWQGIGALACALWWFSPAVWLAARALRREAERACDDLVLSQGVSAPDYADCLLEVASMKPLSLPFAASLVPLARRGELSHRIAALLAPNRDRRSARPLAVVGLTALLLPAGLSFSRPVLADGGGAVESPVAASLRSAARVLPHRQTPGAPPLARSLPSPKAPSAPSPFAVVIPTPPASELQPAATADLAPPAARVASISSAPRAAESPAPASPATAVPAAPETPSVLKGKKIVLDPGHGGTDRGASGGKLYEADVNLAIARKAADALRKEGAIVTLSRDGDSFVSIQDRAKLSAGQDLSLSLHVDSGMGVKSSVRPFPVRVYFHALKDAPAPAEAASLASILARSAGEQAGFVAPDGKVYPLGLAVLRKATCPAYLIDFGSMSYESDLAKLRDPAFLDKLAQGLVDGAKAALSGGNATVAVQTGKAYVDARIRLRFMDADSLVKLLQPEASGKSLTDATFRADSADNSLVVQGTPEAVANLKQLVRMLDQKPRIVQVMVCEVRDGVKGGYYSISTANNTSAHLLSSGGIISEKVEVYPHLNGDGKTISLTLTLGLEKPFIKRIPLGEETKLETPFGIYLVTVTEVTDGATDPK